MSPSPANTIRIPVDLSNPGQFFACCGLLELADRLSPGAEGWFENGTYKLRCQSSLADLISTFRNASLEQLDTADATASPILIGKPFDLRLDWWKAEERSITDLKVWAGTMESHRIAQAMQAAMRRKDFQTEDLFNIGCIAYDVDDPIKKVEPYYFDARRAPNAHSRDVGFAPNDLGMTTTAFPAVELLCLVGLQRCKPASVENRPRIYNYFLWPQPLPLLLLPAAVMGMLDRSAHYQFESYYRTGQKKHKAFQSANLNPLQS